MPDTYREYYERLPVYNGDLNSDTIDFEWRTIVTRYGGWKWTDITLLNCRSLFEGDCKVWQYLEKQEQVKDFPVLRDTTQTDQYYWKKFYFKELIKEGGYKERIPVLCKRDLTSDVIAQIQEKLKKKRIYYGEITEWLTPDTKAAIRNYQLKEELPVGGLNLATLDALRIKY